jgi:threonine dehydrogenase-like Zn-dependent dehydrogenase
LDEAAAPNHPGIVVTRRMELDRAPKGYQTLEHKQYTYVKVVLEP